MNIVLIELSFECVSVSFFYKMFIWSRIVYVQSCRNSREPDRQFIKSWKQSQLTVNSYVCFIHCSVQCGLGVHVHVFSVNHQVHAGQGWFHHWKVEFIFFSVIFSHQTNLNHFINFTCKHIFKWFRIHIDLFCAGHILTNAFDEYRLEEKYESY